MKVVALRRCRWVSTLAATGLILLVGRSLCSPEPIQAQATTEVFAREVERVLPQEELYDYHKRLSQGPVHVARRDR